MAIWNGRFSKNTAEELAEYGESVSFDQRLYAHDIRGTCAHVTMLARQGILPEADADQIIDTLEGVRQDIEGGNLPLQRELEDIHMNIEAAVTERLGEAGGRMHTGRSRNDQIATDERLFLRDEIDRLQAVLADFQKALCTQAADNRTAIMPGFTHLQHAQPILFAHHLLAYVEMVQRDRERFDDCRRRMNRCPLGAGALAGSTLPLDREFVADELGFDTVLQNSMDAVGDRDYLIELLSALAITAMHLSRLAEDVILWCSQEFSFVEPDDAYSTGSSLMPQKKNPDVAELTRGKTGRVYGALMGLLTVMKGLPLTYNRDLQEDKEGVFDALDTVLAMVRNMTGMMSTLRIDAERMREAAADPALMATDLAEWLVCKGVPFRDAHHQVGRFVADCKRRNIQLDEATLEQMRESIPQAGEECRALFSPERSVAARNITGGTAPAQIERQLQRWQQPKTPRE
ncbi:MAG: argininosuccinate lyase [Verrucomicrobiota bacterium]